MKIKFLTAVLSTLVLSNSAFAADVKECNIDDTGELYIKEIVIGASSSNTRAQALGVRVVANDDIAATPVYFKGYPSGYELDDETGKIFLTQLQMAMVNGSIVKLLNNNGDCNSQGFTGITVLK